MNELTVPMSPPAVLPAIARLALEPEAKRFGSLPPAARAVERMRRAENELQLLARRDPLYDSASLRALIEAGESQTLEFKSLWHSRSTKRQGNGRGPNAIAAHLASPTLRPLRPRQVRQMIEETACAFANAYGGTLILGVSDDKTLSGHGYGLDLLVGLLQAIRTALPGVVHVAQLLECEGVELIVFQVEESAEPVCATNGELLYRGGSSVIRVPAQLVADAKRGRRRPLQIRLQARARENARAALDVLA